MADLSDRIAGDPHRTKTKPNLLINGGFDFWQRGTDFLAGAGGFCADRWLVSSTSEAHRSTDVPDAEAPYSIEVFETVDTNGPSLYGSLELTKPNDIAPIIPGKAYTLSFWAKRSESQPFSVRIAFVDVIPSVSNRVVILDTETVAATGGVWEKFVVTFNVAALIPLPTNQAAEILLQPVDHVGTEHMLFALIKLEVGSAVTPFTRAGNTLAGELAMCKRYYQSSFMGTGKIANLGQFAYCSGMLPVTMRRPPVITIGPDPVFIDDIYMGTIEATDLFATTSISSAGLLFTLSIAGTDGNNCAINNQTSVNLNVEAELDLPAA